MVRTGESGCCLEYGEGTFIKEPGGEVAHKTGKGSSKGAYDLAEEAKELGEWMLVVAKAAATGMWEGAKTTFR